MKSNLSMIHDVDLILVEGYKQEQIPRIGIYRKASGKGLPHAAEQDIAVVTDDAAQFPGTVPIFALEDAQGVAEFLKERIEG